MKTKATPTANVYTPKLRLLGMLPGIILVFSVLFVLAYWHDLQNQTTQKQQIEFNLQFERLLQSISNQLKDNEQVLRGIVGLFDASQEIERAEFKAYVDALKLAELHPGILGVGFSKMIEPQNLQNHIKAMRTAGFPDYSVFPAGQRDVYTSIIYLEPFNWRNQRAFGYDMYSEPLRQKAMSRARDTSSTALSDKVILVQETDHDIQAGVLLYVPIFQHTTNQENGKLIGWAYSPLRMKDLIMNLLARDHPNFTGRIAVDIHDGTVQSSESLLFETTRSSTPGFKGFQLKRSIDFAGQTWTVSAHSLPGFVENGPSRENIFLVAGLVFSVMLTTLARILIQGHKRTLVTASALSQFKAIVDSTSDAIISRTLDGTITSWNHGAELMFGYRAPEILGRSIQILIPPGSEQEESTILGRISKGEKVSHIETSRRCKNGQLVEISATIAPILDNNGKVVGSSKIARDITEHKRQEKRLKESEERLALATIHNGVGIWDLDLQNQALIWDDSMFALYHVRREDFSGAVDAWEKTLHPEDREQGNQALQSAIRGENPFDTEFRVIWPNGEIHHIKAIAKVFHDQTGQPIRMLGTNIDITQRKNAEDSLRNREEQLRMVLQGAELGYWDWNMVTGQVERNEQWAKILGYSHEEIQHTTQQWADFVHPDDREMAWQSIYDVINGRLETHKLEYRMLHKEGGIRWILDQAKVMQRNSEGNPVRMSGIHNDITERKQAEIQLQLAAKVFKYAREGITITDADANIIEVNDTFTQITGYNRDEALGQNPSILKSGRHTPEFYRLMWESLRNHGFWSGEIWNRRKSGEVYAELLTISAVQDIKGQTQNYLALFTDITSMKEYQQELERIAHFDPLTGLPNRVLLADRLYQVMIQADRRNQSLAVVYLDLDGFKAINDSKGHQMGDELLIVVSQNMKEVLRESDTLARIGGDEFVAVLVDIENLSDCEPILYRLLQAAAAPVTINDAVLQVSASIGLTIYPQDKADADQLMRHADQAMYVAKQAGKNRFHLFDIEHDTAMQYQLESLAQFRRALDQDEFVLHFQPKVNIKTGAVIGAEALIRWQHPVKGLLMPAEFLYMIDNHAMSEELCEWVINTALIHLAEWRCQGLELIISVNICARQLQQDNFLDKLQHLLAKHPEVPANYLELEILETNVLSDISQVSKLMHACRAIKVRFALDDFGTGYSSLTYLRHLPADVLKIDQSFVRDMLEDPEDLAIVQGVIGLAKAFGREVIAEGVETLAHGKMLISLGCDLVQGYGIARPMPAAEFPDWIIQWRDNFEKWNS